MRKSKEVYPNAQTVDSCPGPVSCFDRRRGACEGGREIIGVIQKNTTDAFHLTINSAAIEKLDALKADGVIDDYRLYDGKTDPMTQCDLMEMAINEECDVVIVLPAEAAGCDPILERGVEAGIPVVVVNSKTNNTDELAAAYVGSDMATRAN